jgi:hypothetical protein
MREDAYSYLVQKEQWTFNALCNVHIVLSRSETEEKYEDVRRQEFVNYMLPDYKADSFYF